MDKETVDLGGVAEDRPFKRAWFAEQVTPCGYRRLGQIMRTVSLPRENSACRLRRNG